MVLLIPFHPVDLTGNHRARYRRRPFIAAAGLILALGAMPLYPSAIALQPFVQPNYLFCGPTAMFTLLDYWGFEHIAFENLSEQLFERSMAGTPNSNLVMAAKRRGMRVYSFTGSRELLRKLLKRRIPVIVLQNVSKRLKLGHYRIVVGMDERKNRILLRDPAHRRIRRMPWPRFEMLWKRGTTFNNNRWAMAIIPPFHPLRAEVLRRSPLTHLNLGSFHYRRFEFQRALMEYEKAYRKDPGHPDVLKFTAQALIRLRRLDRAESLATRLLELHPEDPVADDLLGLIAFYRGDPEKALSLLQRALKKIRDRRENRFIRTHYDQVRRFIAEKEAP